MGRASSGMTIAMEMVIPGLIGLWIDSRLGTTPWLLIAGMVLGFGIGVWQLVKLGEVIDNRTLPEDEKEKKDDEKDQP